MTARRDFVDMIEATDKIRDTDDSINARAGCMGPIDTIRWVERTYQVPEHERGRLGQSR